MSTSKLILTSLKSNVRTITFNRPEKKNAIGPQMYEEVTKIINEDSVNDSVVVTILTGNGDYFTSGNDISAFDNAEAAEARVKSFVAAFINYPKLLIAVINGPAIGIGVTILGLCDIVYASDRATFTTPFLDLGLCPEGCSSYTFPRILGRSKASEMLLLGHKMTAKEAYNFGFVSEVVPHRNLDKLFTKLRGYGKIKVNPLKRAKQLVVGAASMKDVLHETNEREFKALRECFYSEEFSEAIVRKLSRKSKL